jgi:uncharacterized membrane-anchored protein
MKKYKWIFILANLILLLGYMTNSIYQKEELLSNGQLILLELAPVDPRSLIQGDYMRLNYAISNTTREDTISKRGFCVVQLDSIGVAKKVRIQEFKTPLHKEEFLINYTSRKWRGINIGAESYFFQEGEALKFDKAKYGGLKVDTNGNSLLIGLYDENRLQIK